MATDQVLLGRRLLAAKVSAAAWANGWLTISAAAAGCGLAENTYSAVVSNDGNYRPQDETLVKLASSLRLDREELARLRGGVVSMTGDPELDELIERLRGLSPEQRSPVYHLAGLPPQQSSLISNFVRELAKAVNAAT